jgi:hypothetical protein
MTSQVQRIVMAVLSLVAFTVGLASVCLPDDVRSPAYYDGDGDDVGIPQERHPFASQDAIVHTVAHVPPVTSHDCEVVPESRPRLAAAEPRGSESRAPPASSRSMS